MNVKVNFELFGQNQVIFPAKMKAPKKVLEATRLPAAFIYKAPKRIKVKARAKTGFSRLPFVGPYKGPAAPCWSVPATGGYFGGYETGEAMAIAFLKYLRNAEGIVDDHSLTPVATSFMARFEQEGGVEMSGRRLSEQSDSYGSFRGQYVGFFNTLSKWLMGAAKSLGSDLDGVTEQVLVDKANGGLGFDCEAFLRSLSDLDGKE